MVINDNPLVEVMRYCYSPDKGIEKSMEKIRKK